MSIFFILHPTGLLYRFNHKIPIFEPKSMKFGRHVPDSKSIHNIYHHIAILALKMKTETFFF